MTSTNRTPLWRTQSWLAVTAATAATLTGCQLPDMAEADSAGAWSETCPDDRKVAVRVTVDASGSAGLDDVSGDFETAVRGRAARVAMCGGRLRVDAFAGSNAGTEVLFDGSVAVKGSTDTAKARRVPEAVDEVVATVESGFPLDRTGLSGGSDIVGQFWTAQQYVEQLGDGYVLDLVILTDGLDNKTVTTASIVSESTAVEAAKSVPVPELPGAWVTIAGLGEAADEPRDSRETKALVAFYEALCARTGAERCTVAVDYVSPVGG